MAISIIQPALTNAAIIAALGFTPASSNNIGAMAEGSAAAPALSFASYTDLGFYLDGANVMGFAVKGLKHTSLQYQTVNGVADVGAVTRMGRQQTWNTSLNYAYPVTVIVEDQTIGNNQPIVMYDIALGNVHVADTVTQTSWSYTTELDKTDIYADAGAVSFSKGFGGALVRIPQAKTDVTLDSAVGISFTIPDVAGVTGTHTKTKLIHFPSPDLGAPSTYYGCYFDDEYNGGHIVSADAHDLTIYSGRYLYLTAMPAGSNGIVEIDGQGSGGLVRLRQNNRIGLELGTVGTSLNRVSVSANNTPLIMAQHDSTANLSLSLSSKGSSALLLGTNGGVTQVSVSHTASAVNLVQLTGGASGANARIGVTAENLILGTGASRATAATSGYLVQSASNGTPTGVPVGVGTAGVIVIAADYTNKKLHVYNGATASWESGWTLN